MFRLGVLGVPKLNQVWKLILVVAKSLTTTMSDNHDDLDDILDGVFADKASYKLTLGNV